MSTHNNHSTNINAGPAPHPEAHQRAVTFSDRIRFNWGFHDGTAEAERAGVRDMARNPDSSYVDGYLRGVLAWKNLGYRPDSSDDAWNAMVATKNAPTLPAPTPYSTGEEGRPIHIECNCLAALGTAEITWLGVENLYAKKNGLHYYSKVADTDLFAIGMWDFSANPYGAECPELLVKPFVK